jgi:hypothetical protein
MKQYYRIVTCIPTLRHDIASRSSKLGEQMLHGCTEEAILTCKLVHVTRHLIGCCILIKYKRRGLAHFVNMNIDER